MSSTSRTKSKATSRKNGSAKKNSKSLLHAEVEDLHKEMEIADYGMHKSGQKRRMPTRKDQKQRTIKRKSLEKEDVKRLAEQTISGRRLRGSKAAFEDEIVHGSLIFGSGVNSKNKVSRDGDEDTIEDEAERINHANGSGDESEENGRYELLSHEDISEDDDNDNNDDVDVENLVDRSDDEVQDEDDEIDDDGPSGSSPTKKRRRQNHKITTPTDPAMLHKINEAKKRFPQKKIARTMYRLRNFSSHRMAEKHGDALGRHARGMNKSAVSKLKEVASAAPIAPQVYSSLGLVYESMLADEMKKCEPQHQQQPLTGNNEINIDHNSGQPEEIEEGVISQTEEMALLKEAKNINSCIYLAEKTFGSYHVAALLCKLDYTLWLRAGDAAMKIADLHKQCLSLPPVLGGIEPISESGGEGEENDVEQAEKSLQFFSLDEYMQHHEARRMKWLEEAKNDYLAADHIHPPGISVPCKLAYAHIELGNLSEALTILTDMKNNSITRNTSEGDDDDGLRPRSELERSYSAWLLYADLMLTIGFECSKWNRGDQSNSNYMFRRWLRRYSTSFDWKERRLQALCLALEAAAGTKCCEKIVLWMQRRAHSLEKTSDTYDSDYNTLKSSDASEDKGNGEDNAKFDGQTLGKDYKSPVTSLSLDELTKTFNSERARLLSQNHAELEEFDRNSQEMDLVRDAEIAKRAQEREALIITQKGNILNLAGSYRMEKNKIESLIQDKMNEHHKIRPLSLSASCASVFDIASQLMKLCLGMELYSLGALVAHSVSSYLQERALRATARKSNMRAMDQRQIAASSNILQLSKEVYDDLHEDTKKEADDSDSLNYLSDDDNFDHNDNEMVQDAMRNGVLPPELQVLYGTCLIGEEGSDFLAEQLIKALKFLDEDNLKAHVSNNEKTQTDTPLEIFRGAMLNPLNKSSGFAFFTDFILKAKKDSEWSDRLLPIYEGYIKQIESCQEIEILQINPCSLPKQMLRQRNYYVKVLLFLLKLKLNEAHRLNSDGDSEEVYELAKYITSTIHRYRNTLLQEIKRRELSDETIMTIKILAASFQIICNNIENSSQMKKIEKLQYLYSTMRPIICWFCQSPIPHYEDDGKLPQANIFSENWYNFPFLSEWQTEELYMLSRRSFNLSASCNVSCFSGWENDEFDLKLIRRDEGHSYFGVHLSERQVVGYLHSEKASQLASQWTMLDKIAPMLPDLKFDEALKCIKHEDWYRQAILNLESKFSGTVISKYGEEEALNIILMYSNLCLQLATAENDEPKKFCLLAIALSIILPLSQFCLDRQLWNSDIGTNAIKNETISEWKHFAQTDDPTEAAKPPCRQKPSASKKPYNQRKTPQYNLAVHKSTNSRLISPLMKLIKVPVEVLLKEWNGGDIHNDDEDREYLSNNLNKWSQNISGPATIAMKRVDFTLQKLRQCSSITALQKRSLQVAVALLDLVSTKECHNPFLCLQHAAIFSSQGCKGGNYDEEFKKPLPEEAECTPNEAIGIIGRADCLRSIHFIDEAMFICSFVAKVCRLHRDKKSNMEWNSKWRVVAILMYTTSVCIDATIYSFMEGETRNSALQSWASDVKAEISRARSDAIALQRAFSLKSFNGKRKSSSMANTSSVPNENENNSIINDYESNISNDDLESNFQYDYDDDSMNEKDENCEDHEEVLEDGTNENELKSENVSTEPPEFLNPIPIPQAQFEYTGMNNHEAAILDEGEGMAVGNLDEVPIIPI